MTHEHTQPTNRVRFRTLPDRLPNCGVDGTTPQLLSVVDPIQTRTLLQQQQRKRERKQSKRTKDTAEALKLSWLDDVILIYSSTLVQMFS